MSRIDQPGRSSTQDQPPVVKRLLMVAHLFPPLGGGGVQRTLKFATYLPDSGWEPIVLTAVGAGYEIRDAGLLAVVPSAVRVVRARTIEPWWPAYRALQRLQRRSTSLVFRVVGPTTTAVRQLRTQSVAKSGPRVSRTNITSPGLARRLAAAVLFPDEQIAWLPSAVVAGRRVHATRPLTAIYSTSGPFTDHLVAGLLKRRTGLPWVADFRDPWVDSPWATPLPRPHRAFQRYLERWVVEGADRIVSVTPGLTQALRQRYPDQAEKIITISNGYDPADLREIPDLPRSRARFRLMYAGALYGDSELRIFLEGLILLLDRRPELRGRLEVDFVGYLDGPNQAIASRFAARLDGIVTYMPYRPRREALALARSADAGLFLIAGDPRKSLAIGGKLFEYIGLDIPVLAMVPPGDAKDLLAQLTWGTIADPDPASVAEALEGMIDSSPRVGRADPEGLYDRRNLTKRLAALLDDLVDAAARGPAGQPL